MEVKKSDDTIAWNWISKDKRIKKRIIERGWWRGTRPLEGSPCILSIDTSNYEDFTIPTTHRMPSIDQHKLIVGEGDTVFERMCDRLLLTMDTMEQCLVQYIIENNVYHVKIKLIQHGEGSPTYNLDPNKKFTKALAHKVRGVELFQEGRILDASHRFKQAVQLLVFLEYNENDYLSTYLKVCNNLAQCHLHFGNYEQVLLLCNKVLDKDPTNVKCLLRRATALESLRDFEKALTEYKKVIKIESNNIRALQRLPFVKKEVDEMYERYNQTVKRMFKF